MRVLALVLLATALSAADLVEITPGLRLAIPDGWTVEVATDRVTRVWRDPQGTASVAILVQGAEDQRDAQAHLDESLGLLQRLATGFQILQARAASPRYGGAWQQARYRLRTGERSWDQDVLLSRRGNRIVAITCSAETSAFAAAEPTFDRIRAALGTKASTIGLE